MSVRVRVRVRVHAAPSPSFECRCYANLRPTLTAVGATCKIRSRPRSSCSIPNTMLGSLATSSNRTGPVATLSPPSPSADENVLDHIPDGDPVPYTHIYTLRPSTPLLHHHHHHHFCRRSYAVLCTRPTLFAPFLHVSAFPWRLPSLAD